MQLEDLFRNIATITMKLTMGCNLKCTYCNTETVTPQTPMMSIDMWKRVAKLLMENSKEKYVSMEFHGGEPTLLSDEWFDEATSYTRDLAKKHGKLVDLPMVTNGTTLTPERLMKLHNLGIGFCISCDGPPEINDIFRGGGNAVERAIRMFHEHKIDVGVMTVMSKANYSRMYEILDWFRTLDMRSFAMNFVQPQGRGIDEDLLSSEQMFEGMRQVFDHMVDTDVSIYDAEMGNHIQRFVEGRQSNPRPSCWEFQCQAGKSYIAIDLYGNIHPCGSDMSNHVFANLDEDFSEERYKRHLNRLHDKGDWAMRCFDCNAQQICNHSCPTSDYNSLTAKENECGYTKMLWTHFCQNADKVQRIWNTMKQRGMYVPRAFVPLVELEQSAAGLSV